MRRRRPTDKPRERRTLVPAFDPEARARHIEAEANRETSVPPFDPADFARQADVRFEDEVPTETELAALPDDAAEQVLARADDLPEPVSALAIAFEDTADARILTEAIGREMYGCYLASDFPEALVLAERVLERDPGHAMAQAVREGCRERLRPRSAESTLRPSSIVRLNFAALERQSRHIDVHSSGILGLVDGVSDTATVAMLAGLSQPEALDRLHALLDLGVIEVVRTG